MWVCIKKKRLVVVKEFSEFFVAVSGTWYCIYCSMCFRQVSNASVAVWFWRSQSGLGSVESTVWLEKLIKGAWEINKTILSENLRIAGWSKGIENYDFLGREKSWMDCK